MQIALSGELTAEGHRLVQRVYYEDTDFSGVVYHARYLHFMERARTDYLRLLGVEQAAMAVDGDAEGLVFVVHRMEIDFKAPARMDDILTIDTRTEKAAAPRWCSSRPSPAAKPCSSPPASSSPSSTVRVGPGDCRKRLARNFLVRIEFIPAFIHVFFTLTVNDGTETAVRNLR